VTVQTFVPCVQDLQQEVHHSVMHFANFVQTYVRLVLLNVKNFQHTIVAKSVPKLATNAQKLVHNVPESWHNQNDNERAEKPSHYFNLLLK
jgi:hypothetical protein